MRIETKDFMNYNYNVKIIAFFVIILSLTTMASRMKVDVAFVDLPQVSDYVPFSVIAPSNISGDFVRFIHPRNGKSAVAKIVKSEGNEYKVSQQLAVVIGVSETEKTTLFVEEVY